MALINSVLGRMRGKIGDVVFQQNKGRQIAKLYQPQVANPRSGQQQANRSRFVALMAIGRTLMAVLRLGFKEYAGSVSWLNRFMSTNSSSGLLVFNEITASWLPNYNNLVIAEGSLLQENVTFVSLVGATLTLEWSTGTLGNQSSNDKLVLVAFCNEDTVTDIGSVERSAGTIIINFPNVPAVGDTVSFATYFFTADGRIVSNSYAFSFEVEA